MHFPTWVTAPTDPQTTEATRRLRYLINRAAVECTPGCSVSAFAEFVGIDVSAIHMSISNGCFSPRSAMKIERAVNNTALITAAGLCYPLEIE